MNIRKSICQNSISNHDFLKKKQLCKPGIAGNFFNLIKGIYEKPTDNITPDESFPPEIRNKQGCTFSPLLFNIFF